MSWWMHNPIADMYGPDFLFLYSCVIVATLVGCRWRLRSIDPTADLTPLPLGANPDPYEIAYLRAGENEVARVAIFDLIQRGYVQVTENKKWWGGTEQRLARAPDHPDPRHLSTMGQKLFGFFSSSCTAADIFQSHSQSPDLKGLCGDYERKLQEQQMLCPPEVGTAAWRVGSVGALIILFLGAYKLMVALAKGRHNVGFLILMGFVSLFFLVFVCRPPRLSRLGKDYLKRIQGVFDRLKPTAATAGVTDTTLLLLVSLFGVSVLADTSYAYFNKMFRQSGGSYSDLGGGCGGGCGGGGCGGGGCGGCGGG